MVENADEFRTSENERRKERKQHTILQDYKVVL